MKHEITTREEWRFGMREPEFRVRCTCGFQDKTFTKRDAANIAAHHTFLHKQGRA